MTTSGEAYRALAGRTKRPDESAHVHPILAYRLYLMMKSVAGDWGILSGVRTYEQQKYLYDGYRRGKAGFNLAANPDRVRGTNFEGVVLKGSNHQAGGDGWGRAVDMRTSVGWSPLHGALSRFGLRLTVRGEPWHWAASDMGGWYDGPFPEPGFRTLKRPMRGGDVKALQEQAAKLGIKLDVDGRWGKETQAAVEALQTKVGVDASGEWSHGDQLAYTAVASGKPVPKDETAVRPRLDGTQQPDEFLPGLDLSHWQGDVNWNAVARDADWVYIKSSEGMDHSDPRWEQNAAGAASVDIEWGAYHFGTPSGKTKAAATADGRAEAEFFLSKLAGKTPTLRPCLDLEQNRAASSAHLGAWIAAFLDVIEDRIGVLPVVYTGFYFMRDEVGSHAPPKLADTPLWLAWYGRKLTDEPPAPPPWDDWDTWQYSSSGRRGGETSIDLNVMRAASLPKMRLATAKLIKPPKPKPKPKPDQPEQRTWRQWADRQIRHNTKMIEELRRALDAK